jgi:hypothetical protein
MAEYRVTTAQSPTDLLTLRTEPGWVIAYGTGDDIPEGATVNGLDGPWAGEAAAVIAAFWACSGAWGPYQGDGAMDILDAVDEADQDIDHRMREWSRPGRWFAAVQVRVVERDAAVARAEAAERDAAIARAVAEEREAIADDLHGIGLTEAALPGEAEVARRLEKRIRARGGRS